MVSDDIVYGLFMLTSVAIGPVFTNFLTLPASKRLASSLVGLLLLWIVCGGHIVHIFINIIGNCILISLIPPAKNENVLPWKSFAWNFGYLVVFRTIHWFGLPAPSPVTNAAQLFLTLKMVGLAFEIQDSFNRSQAVQSCSGDEKSDAELKIKYCNIRVSVFEVVNYAFCYIGLLTGPYYKYRTYQDWLESTNSPNIDNFSPLIYRAKQLPVIAICFLFFSYFFNIQYVETEEFSERSFLFRLFYMVPMFTIFRTRLYMAWIFSECMSMTANFGAYPVKSKPRCGDGPSDLKQLDIAVEEEKAGKALDYDFETIHNIDIYGCELAPMTKQGLRSWNMTVQYWLASFVHKRVPPALKAHRVAITMTVSAFWHGIHPGYYLSFLTVPPILMAEEVMIKAFREDATPEFQKIFDWGCWFCKMRGFDYMCMGFLLLKFGSTLRYWYSVYFIVHLAVIILFVIGKLRLVMKKKKAK
ncbi:lysophospholipid acyltransferase 7 [Plakobranchus ocellatus]|uniref:Lysophospholipid acyltransferase 7 n=1 Tax=Plakobranchus ocellatus TaxID=259542 RepID=A0AAV3ZLL1_9GAST|nr:lysophospholipid acyltransferase 7 [Plakobranchus ocellatus]